MKTGKLSQKLVKYTASVLTAALLASSLAGCGGGNTATTAASQENQTEASGTGETSAAAEAETSAERITKDALRVAFRNEPNTMDPTGSTSLTAFAICYEIFDRLIEDNGDGTFSPSLAESWEQVDDLTMRFHLRDDVYFHNGEKMTAEDVVYSIARAETSSYSSSYFGYFNGAACEAVDDTTVDLKVYEPFAPMLKYLASARGSIVCKSDVESRGVETFGREPIGTGKFKFESWESGSELVVAKNENYWGDNDAPFDKIVNRFITDTSTRAIEVESGGVDIAFHIGETDAARLESGSNTKVQIGPSYNTFMIRFDTVYSDVFSDVNVRKAMRMALDMPSIVNAVYGTSATVATSFFSDQIIGHKAVGPEKYDPEGAKKLLEESGFDLSKTYTIYSGNDNTQIAVLEAVTNQWKQVGLNVEISVMDSATLSTAIRDCTGTTYLVTSSTNATTGDPDHGLFVYKGSDCTTHKDQKAFDMIAAAVQEYDTDKRRQMYEEIQDYLWDMCVTIPVAYTSVIYGTGSDVAGLPTDPGYTPDLTKVYFE